MVSLDGSKPALRPCRWCGSCEGRLDEPRGPHGHGIRCNGCNRHLGWLPKEKALDDFDLIE